MNRYRFVSALAMVALAGILLPSSLTAQITFQRTYGGPGDDYGSSVQQTADSGYIIAGYTSSYGTGGIDVYLLKTDARGDTLWTRTFGGAYNDYGFAVQQTGDGGYVIAGADSFSMGTWGYTCFYLVKTDANGGTLWTRTWGPGDSYAYSVQQTTDGGYIVTGVVCSNESTMSDVPLMKTDANGDTLWTRFFFGTGWDDWGNSVQQTTDGGYVIAGANSTGQGDVYLIKTNADGDTLWTRAFGGTGNDEGHSVQQTADSGYIIAGYTRSFGAGDCDVYLIKTDGNGDAMWTRTFGGTGGDYGYSVQQSTDGGYVIAGTTGSFGAGGDDIYLIKTNANGYTMWTKTFGGTGGDYGYSVQQSTDGGYVIAGTTGSFGAGGDDVYLIKTDSLGSVAVAEPKTSPTRVSAISLSCEPNPFAGATAIRLSPFATRSSPLTLRIYDAQGRAVRSFSSLLSAPFSLTWDGTDELGQPLPSGAYFVRADAGNEHATARIVLQR